VEQVYWRVDRKLGTISRRLAVQLRKLRLYGADQRVMDDVVRAAELVTRAAARFAADVEEGWRPAHGSRNAAQGRVRRSRG
jgi:hypothetical protein